MEALKQSNIALKQSNKALKQTALSSKFEYK